MCSRKKGDFVVFFHKKHTTQEGKNAGLEEGTQLLQKLGMPVLKQDEAADLAVLHCLFPLIFNVRRPLGRCTDARLASRKW